MNFEKLLGSSGYYQANLLVGCWDFESTHDYHCCDESQIASNNQQAHNPVHVPHHGNLV